MCAGVNPGALIGTKDVNVTAVAAFSASLHSVLQERRLPATLL